MPTWASMGTMRYGLKAVLEGTGLAMRYTLMNQEHEVLDFVFDVGTGEPEEAWPLEGIAWAPLDMAAGRGDLVPALSHFMRRRALSRAREDLPQILRARGAENPVELALGSGGFSLSDQYWYRAENSPLTWANSNFFDNGWDVAFGEAVLRKDYASLASASPRTPDATLGGFCRKAWVRTERGLRLLKASPTGDVANVYGEALASRMLERLVGERGHIPYEPMMFEGELYSSCPLRFGRNEELVSGVQLLAGTGFDVSRITAQTGVENFETLMSVYLQTLDDLGVPGGREAMAKVFVIASLVLDFDTHPSNFGFIRDVRTLGLRPAPLFDHGRAFLYMRDKYEMVRKSPVAADFILGLYFSRLDPTWDYSWYDPHALDGFEDEIAASLSAVKTLPEGYAELMANLFMKQRAYVNRVASRS